MPKKILHIVLSLGVGGAERVVSDFITNDQSGICQHTVCCFDSIGVFGEELIEQGIKVVLIPRRPGKDWRLIFKIATFIRKEKIDIVHAHGETPWFYGALAAKTSFCSVRCVTTIHGYGGGDRTSVSDYRLWKFLSRLTDKIVVVADNLRTEMVQAGFSKQQVMTVLNGVNSNKEIKNRQKRSQWGLKEGHFVVGIVARLAPIKNHQLLFQAFALLANKYPDVRLVIVGDGPENESLQQLSVSLVLADKIVFCGEQQQAQSFYPLFDVFVLPSLSEGISMTLLEAMAAQIPVVASAVGGNCEIISDSESGLLFPSGDVGALYERLKQLYVSQELRQKLSMNGLIRIKETFDVQCMIQNYLKIYEDMTRGKSI